MPCFSKQFSKRNISNGFLCSTSCKTKFSLKCIAVLCFMLLLLFKFSCSSHQLILLRSSRDIIVPSALINDVVSSLSTRISQKICWTKTLDISLQTSRKTLQNFAVSLKFCMLAFMLALTTCWLEHSRMLKTRICPKWKLF